MKTGFKRTAYSIFQRILFACRPLKSKASECVNLIYKPDAIGDFLLAGGVIRELIKRKPGNWVLICAPQVEDLAKHLFPEIDLVVMQGANRLDSGNALAKMRSLRPFCRTHRIETLVCLRHSLTGMDHILLNWLDPAEASGISLSPIPAPTPGPFRSFRFHHQPSYPTERGQLPLEVHAHLAVVNPLLEAPLQESDGMPFMNLPERAPNNPPELAIFPVTRSRLRNYPLPKLAEAVNRFLVEKPDFRVVLFGTLQDENALCEFQRMLRSPHPVKIEYPASILDAARRIQSTSLLLSMDSAPAHICVILKKPGVFILAGAQFNHFAPWGPTNLNKWISHYKPCYYCNWNCKYEEPLCVTQIDTTAITDQLLSLSRTSSC